MPQPPASLKEFYAFMAATVPPRRRLVEALLQDVEPLAEDLRLLRGTLASLEAIPEEEGRRVLDLDGTRQIRLDLGYELGELQKDLFYLEHGENAFLDHLAALHQDFIPHVREGRKQFKGLLCNCLVADRDGTVNNYCGRYLSSIQSVYNAVFLSRFAGRHVTNPVLLTSAPLQGGGIADVSVNPPRTFVYAASKGRECLDLSGNRHHFPVPREKQQRLDTLNARITALTAQPEFEIFTLIGSGVQKKFGQTSIARQDIVGTVPPERSEQFLQSVRALVLELDPTEETFRIEDTGLDIEIMLTVEHAQGGLKDFDKGDGLAWLDRTLSLNLVQGPHLVCGDTASDLPMLRVAFEQSRDVRAVFVTRKPELAAQVRELCPDALVLPEPDMLVTLLGLL